MLTGALFTYIKDMGIADSFMSFPCIAFIYEHTTYVGKR